MIFKVPTFLSRSSSMSQLVHTSEVSFKNIAQGKMVKLVHQFLYIDSSNSFYFTTQASSQHEADHMNQAVTNHVSRSAKFLYQSINTESELNDT